MRYNVAQAVPVGIQRGYLYGYYEGAVQGMGSRAITDPKYHTPGALKIRLADDPYKF